jgi:hypothetical protein
MSTPRRGPRAALYIGTRRVLAMTCWNCGKLRQGAEFARRPMRGGAYIDRRCRTTCRWRGMEVSPGR